MALFSRAFLYCADNRCGFDAMAEKLATIQWHLLNRERSEIPVGPTYRDELERAVAPAWRPLLVIGENRYRVSSSAADADGAWSSIRQQLFGADLYMDSLDEIDSLRAALNG